MKIQLPRDFADHPLLRMVSDLLRIRSKHFLLVLCMNSNDCAYVDVQVRELADEEILQDVDFSFGRVS